MGKHGEKVTSSDEQNIIKEDLRKRQKKPKKSKLKN